MNRTLFSALAALTVGFSAEAGLYTFNSDTGDLLPSGSAGSGNLSFSHLVSDPSASIQNLILTLGFTSSDALNGGVRGFLYLGSGTTPFQESLTPVSPALGTGGVGGAYYWTLNFGPSSQFDGQNPSSTWTLNLWDSASSGFGNTLTGWSLDINPVPEPVSVALVVFGGLALGAKLVSWRVKRLRAAVRG